MKKNASPPKWNPEFYNKNSCCQQQYAHKILDNIKFHSEEKVLDIGCGDGKVSAYVAKNKVPQGLVDAVDASQEMIAFAQKEFQTITYPNINFSVQDVRALPYFDNYDKVISFWCLHWISEQEKALYNIKNSLKKGGSATLVLTAATPSYDEMIENVKKVAQRTQWKKYLNHIQYPLSWPQRTDEYQKLLEKVGFKSAQVTEVKDTFRSTTVNDYFNARKATLPHARVLPDSLADEFTKEAFDFLVEDKNINADGSIDHEIAFLVVEAVK